MGAQLIVIMGASGCGKTTVAQALADRTGFTFLEGDDFHPKSNLCKMASGIPLDDRDRAVWIDHLIDAANQSHGTVILACSALTKYVQQRLSEESIRPVKFCLLEMEKSALTERVESRQNHFMPAELVTSQLANLDPPADALKFNGDQSVSDIVDKVLAEVM